MFGNLLEREEAFFDYEKHGFKTKICIFLKELVHGFFLEN